MSSNRNEHLRYRYGICLNDNCEKCKSKEVQQVPARKDFMCESCGKPLRECPPPKSFGQKYGKLIVIGAAIVVVIGVALIFIFLPSKNETPESEITPVDSIVTDTIVPVVITQPDTAINEVINDSLRTKALADSIKLAKADSILQAQEAAQSAVVESPKTTPAEKPASAKPNSSNHSLNYGKWNGSLRNGQPHGNGTMTYTTSRTIDSRDPKGRVAQPGEYIVGEWDNGHLVQGRWFKKDGSKEAVIIGKAG